MTTNMQTSRPMPTSTPTRTHGDRPFASVRALLRPRGAVLAAEHDAARELPRFPASGSAGFAVGLLADGHRPAV